MSDYTKSTNFATKDNLTPGDPLKIVRGTEIDTEFNNIATAIATKTDNASAAITGGSITGITDLAIADGGTGASTANAALNNLLPSQASASGKYLKSNGTDSSWDALDISTADITGTLPVANGGTGVTSSTGTGSVVLSNSPTLVTPALGTPASGVATNLTGLPLTTGVTGTLPIANGGTGQTTANNAFNALAPSQATASGKYLKSDGTNTSWDALDISTADITGTLPVANGGTGVTTSTGTGSVVLSNSPTLVTPALGTPSSATLTNATGLPISTGVSGLGTGVATALAVNVGSAGAPVVNGGALGTPSSGTVTNLTGTASININGTVGATTPTTGAFTTVAASSSVTLSGGTANGVTYLNGSKVLTSGSALTFDGTNFATTGSGTVKNLLLTAGTLPSAGNPSISLRSSDNTVYHQSGSANTTVFLDSAQNTMQSISATSNIFAISNAEQMRLNSTGLGIGTSSPAAKLHVKGTGTSGQVTSSFILENGSSGTAGMDITGAAGSSYLRLLYGGGPSTGTNTLSLGMSMLLEGASAGNVGIGTSSPGAKLHVKQSGANVNGIYIEGSANDSQVRIFNNGTVSGISSTYGSTGSYLPLTFLTSDTERARIDSSGNLLVGTTSSNFQTGERVSITPASGKNAMGISLTNTDSLGIAIYSPYTATAAVSAMKFQAHTAAIVGSITFTSTATTYNTSSDYRLKNTITPMTGALAKVSLLKPCTYKWNFDGSDSQGFIAHELAEVVPECVTGEKDAVDADGNPVYQGIDTSFLVATLTAALQELNAKFDAYVASHP